MEQVRYKAEAKLQIKGEQSIGRVEQPSLCGRTVSVVPSEGSPISVLVENHCSMKF